MELRLKAQIAEAEMLFLWKRRQGQDWVSVEYKRAAFGIITYTFVVKMP